jgi:RHS repeat-associated protein
MPTEKNDISAVRAGTHQHTGREKFGTYFRDSGTRLDYADQRYYQRIYGRFFTPDPAGLKAVNLKNPISWNRYAYVNDDPIDLNDPSGLVVQCDSQGSCVDTGVVTKSVTDCGRSRLFGRRLFGPDLWSSKRRVANRRRNPRDLHNHHPGLWDANVSS